MSKIFNTPYATTEVINASGAVITYATVPNGLRDPSKAATSGGKSLPFGVQGLTLQIQRPVQQSYSLAADKNGQNSSVSRYLYLGQTVGSLAISGLFGPSSSLKKLADAISDGCASLTFWIKPGTSTKCSDSLGSYKGETLKVYGCTLDSFTFSYAMGQSGIAMIKYPLSFKVAGVQIQD